MSAAVKKLLVVNGPNLNLLGAREPDIYGHTTLREIESRVREQVAGGGHEVLFFQSNSEGDILDFLQREGPAAAGIVLNPGALTHYSYALYDCLRALGTPVVEVHLSNLHARSETEHFRSRNVTAPAAVGVISGLGSKGYLLAVEYLLDGGE
jgi:3-dehydroquinate dehydratase-2